MWSRAVIGGGARLPFIWFRPNKAKMTLAWVMWEA
ncbi:hypothetical protein EJ110_NYTH37214 [Nymphaea thermarum]|nr:hypothetical protein EJ110_NYTH37214 [Nymphaea thermarum]